MSKPFRLPLIRSFPEYMMNFIARQDANRVAFIDADTRQQYTYGQVHALVKRLGSSLNQRCIGRGDVICLCASNCVDYGVIVLAVTSVGAVVTTANPAYTIDELAFQLKDSGSDYIIADEEAEAKMREAARRCRAFKDMFVINRQNGLTSLYNEGDSHFDFAPVDPANDVMTLLYSSGTTGLPKGVMQTHHNHLSTLTVSNDPEVGFPINVGGDRQLLFLPQFHMFGLSVTFLGLLRGDIIIIMRKFNMTQVLRTIEEFKVTVMAITPPVAVLFSKSDDVTKTNLTSLRCMVCAAAPLRHQVAQEVARKTGIVIQQAYGVTELSGIVTFVPSSKWKQDSTGLLLPDAEGKIIDPTTGAVLPPGQSGELCIRGPSVTKGYLNNEQATRQAYDKDGWFHTGDLAYFDKDGHLFITNRLKETIKCYAYQVSPAEIEAVLLEHSDIFDAAVIGIPDDEAGEVPKAFVVRKQGSRVSEEDIIQFIQNKVAPYKRLRGGVEFTSQIPKLPSGKILRRLLVQQHNNASMTKSKL